MAAGWMNAQPIEKGVTKIKSRHFPDRPHIFRWACQKGLEWQSKCGVFRMVDLLSAVHQRTTVAELMAAAWMNPLVNVECTIYLRISR